MDPTEALGRLRELLGGDHTAERHEALGGKPPDRFEDRTEECEELHALVCGAEESFQGLDTWLVRGGALPSGWRRRCAQCGEPMSGHCECGEAFSS